uniref:Uncharacterized protein n=1 Tax=Timema genevievae TaxID=629358 RepID=A0A7R9PLQ6_TIMGE|nr:unnamed protein product [Timema genevievae]
MRKSEKDNVIRTAHRDSSPSPYSSSAPLTATLCRAPILPSLYSSSALLTATLRRALIPLTPAPHRSPRLFAEPLFPLPLTPAPHRSPRLLAELIFPLLPTPASHAHHDYLPSPYSPSPLIQFCTTHHDSTPSPLFHLPPTPASHLSLRFFNKFLPFTLTSFPASRSFTQPHPLSQHPMVYTQRSGQKKCHSSAPPQPETATNQNPGFFTTNFVGPSRTTERPTPATSLTSPTLRNPTPLSLPPGSPLSFTPPRQHGPHNSHLSTSLPPPDSTSTPSITQVACTPSLLFEA